MSNTKKFNYPPEELLDPNNGSSPNFELLILWMLKNNNICEWKNLSKKITPSTLSNYLNNLIKRGYIKKIKRGQYEITSEGLKRFRKLSSEDIVINKLNYPPNTILKGRNYDDIILWMTFNNQFLRWGDFLEKPLSINQSSLSKNLSLLIEKGVVEKEDRKYKITSNGISQYSEMLKKYNLDKQTLIEVESKIIKEIINKAKEFFNNYGIIEEKIIFRFLKYLLKIDYSKLKKSISNNEDLYKILLFISINHPEQFPNYVSFEEFSLQYKIKKVVLEFYIYQIVDRGLFSIKFFKIKDHHRIYYLPKDEKLERIIKTILNDEIERLTLLNTFYKNQKPKYLLQGISNLIANTLDQIFDFLFDPELKKALKKFLFHYIENFTHEIEKKKKFNDRKEQLEGVAWQGIQNIFKLLKSDKKFNLANENSHYFVDPNLFKILKPYLDSKEKLFNPLFLGKKKNLDITLKKINLKIKNTGDIELIIYKAIILCLKKKFVKVEKILTNNLYIDIIKKEWVNISFSFIICFVYICLGKFHKALKVANKIINQYPKHPLVYTIKTFVLGYNIIYNFDNSKENSEFIDVIDKALFLESSKLNKIQLYIFKSIILFKLGEIKRALRIIDIGIELNPHEINFYLTKIKILIESKNYQKTIKLIDNIISQFPNYKKDLLKKKTYVLLMIQNYKEGLELLDSLIKLYPSDPDFLNNKIYALTNLNKKEEALTTAKSLLRIAPENGNYHDTFGEALMKFGEYEEAIKEFETAIRLSPKEWFIYQTYIKMGIALKNIGNYDNSIKQLKRGVEIIKELRPEEHGHDYWVQKAEKCLLDI